MNVKDYIEKYHDDICYCEAIIYPNGDIEEANPGHTYKLMSVTDKSREELDKIIPNNASPLEWLLGYTNCVAIWYDFFKYGSITKEQLDTIQELVNHGMLSNGITGYYTDEIIRCDLLNKIYKGELSIDSIPDRLNNKIQIWRNKYD